MPTAIEFNNISKFYPLGWLDYSFGCMLVVLALGILIFNKVQKNFMDIV